MKILLKIAYNGTNYCGWQRQPNVDTVEGQLYKALKKIYKHEIILKGASRTDAKVHALAQYATFEVIENKIPFNRLPQVINKILPDDIVVRSAIEVPIYFNARYSAKEKTYTYCIQNGSFLNPIYRNLSCYERKKLDLDLMKEGSKYFIGTHDFSAFRTIGGNVKTTVRTIYKIDFEENNNIITITFNGNSFLYNMVRIMTGTLIKVGHQKIKPEKIQEIILSKDRSLSGKTAEPHGLTLVDIKYD